MTEEICATDAYARTCDATVIAAGEDGVELVALDRALEPELCGAIAGPAPRRLALARVIVVGAAGHRSR